MREFIAPFLYIFIYQSTYATTGIAFVRGTGQHTYALNNFWKSGLFNYLDKDYKIKILYTVIS